MSLFQAQSLHDYCTNTLFCVTSFHLLLSECSYSYPFKARLYCCRSSYQAAFRHIITSYRLLVTKRLGYTSISCGRMGKSVHAFKILTLPFVYSQGYEWFGHRVHDTSKWRSKECSSKHTRLRFSAVTRYSPSSILIFCIDIWCLRIFHRSFDSLHEWLSDDA